MTYLGTLKVAYLFIYLFIHLFVCFDYIYLFICLIKILSFNWFVVFCGISQILDIIFRVESVFILSSYACS